MDSKIFKAKNRESGVLSATLLAATVNSASVTPTPNYAPGVIVLRPGTAFEEHIYYKTKDSGAGTISGLTRDYTNLNGGTGFEHTNGSSWETLQASEYLNNIVDAILEGYQQEQSTIAYVGATSFTVLGDVTAFYTQGRILRYNQDNTKIGIVASSSYSGGSGLTTVVTNYGTVPAVLTHVEIGIMPKAATNLVALTSDIQNASYIYAADSGGSDAYAITLAPAITAYVTGQLFLFKANTINTGAATLNVNGLGAKTIKKNVSSDLATGDILAGQLVKVIYDGTNFQLVSTIPAAALNAPQGFLTNGKIVPSVAASDLTVAIKTLAGADPSASDPVYCRIGDTVRSITAALSVTKNDATNWFNSGSAELATKEVDYFVYLGYNATDGVVIGFSRIPSAAQYSDFSVTTTNEKYCAISTITTAASTDYYEVIGRFAATLSAGAGYTWSVPTFTAINLIQRPIYESRWLTWTPTFTGFSANPTAGVYRYKVSLTTVIAAFLEGSNGTSNAAGFTETLPFTAAGIGAGGYFRVVNNSASADGGAVVAATSNSLTLLTAGGSTFVSSGGKRIQEGHVTYEI